MGIIARVDAACRLASHAWLIQHADEMDGRERRWRMALWAAAEGDDAPPETTHDALRIMMMVHRYATSDDVQPLVKPQELAVAFSVPTIRPVGAVLLEQARFTEPHLLQLGDAARIYHLPRGTLQGWINRGLLASLRKHESLPHVVYDREVANLAPHYRPGGGQGLMQRVATEGPRRTVPSDAGS